MWTSLLKDSAVTVFICLTLFGCSTSKEYPTANIPVGSTEYEDYKKRVDKYLQHQWSCDDLHYNFQPDDPCYYPLDLIPRGSSLPQTDNNESAPRPCKSVQGAEQRYGYADGKGHLVIPCKFVHACEFKNGIALVSIVSPTTEDRFHELWGYIYKNGKFMLKPKFEKASEFKNGLARVCVKEKGIQEPSWGYINTSGRFVIAPNFIEAQDFSEGLARVEVQVGTTDLWGFIDQTGRFRIAPQFYDARAFSQGLAAVAFKNDVTESFGFIDKEGKFQIAINSKFLEAKDFSDGLAAVFVEGKWGYIDRTGGVVIKPEFERAYNFKYGVAEVNFPIYSSSLVAGTAEDSFFFIDKTGRRLPYLPEKLVKKY